MRLAAFALAVVSFVAPAIGQSRPPRAPASKPIALEVRPDAPANIKALFSQWQDQKISERKEAADNLADAKAEIAKLHEEARSNPSREQYVSTYERREKAAQVRLSLLSDPNYFFVPRLDEFSVGEIGQIPLHSLGMWVDRVQDEKHALIEVRIGPDIERGERNVKMVSLWVETDTTNWIDGQKVPASFSSQKAWKIAGAHRGIGGTVPTIEPFDYEKYLEPKSK